MTAFVSMIGIIWVFSIHGVSSSNLFTGTDGMKKLSKAEHLVVNDLQVAADAMQAKVDLMKSIVAEIKRIYRKPQDELELAGHPVQAYHLIKRWHHIQQYLAVEDENNLKDKKKKIPVVLGCRDEHPSCKQWALTGECSKNPDYMLDKCQEACKICRHPRPEDSPKIYDHSVAGVCEKLNDISGVTIPNKVDFEGARQGLVRLQRTYKLETASLISGVIRGHKSVNSLLPDDFYNIGKEAVDMLEWGYAVQWLKRALSYNNKDRSEVANINVQLVKAYLGMNDMARAHSAILKALGEQKPVIVNSTCVDSNDNCKFWASEGECKKNPKFMTRSCKYSCSKCAPEEDTLPAQTMLQNLNATLQRKARIHGWSKTLPEPNDERTVSRTQDWKPAYEELCRGQGTRTYHNAVCRLRASPLPYYVYKEEILCMNPRIAMVYEVISDEEAEYIKNISYTRMKRGQVGSDKRYSNDRVSKVGWLLDSEKYIGRLSERIEMITGLEVTHQSEMANGQRLISSDELQVVNYGIGGHYEPHTDYFELVTEAERQSDIAKTVSASGDRLATFLMYLSDVEAGGGTVYPRAKIFVPPVKNAAAFWYNAQLSGKYDPLTLHAGCPILLGEKWVANKWIREFGNHFNRKCALSLDAKYS